MNFKAALFDLDGTLFDSTYVWTKVDEIFLAKRGFAVPPDYVECIAHFSLKEAAVYTKDRFGLDDSLDDIMKEWKQLALDEYSCNVGLKENALKYLDFLKSHNIKLAVTTGLPRALMTPALTRLGLIEYFDLIASVDDVGKGKGCPDLYIYTAKTLAVNLDECIAFDDVLTALKVMKSIGITICGVEDKASALHKKEIIEISDFYINDWQNALLIKN